MLGVSPDSTGQSINFQSRPRLGSGDRSRAGMDAPKRGRLQTDAKRSALNGVTSTNGSSPVIMDAISRPVTAPSVKP
jgi:hypothetical protein